MFTETNHLKFLILSSDFIKNQYLNKQCTSEVARLLSLEPEFDWNIITELDLSSLNILHIVGLRLVTNLKSLRLAHNRIKKIENLHWLTKLENLDLSLNRLTDIENVDSLTDLKYLNVAGNQISELKNLDENTALETFVVSDNRITDVNQIFYMQRFKSLRFMNVANNAFTVDDSFKQLIVEQFPNLHYFNNKRITELDRPPHDHSSANPKITNETMRLAFLTDVDGKQYIGHLFDDDDDGILLSKWNTAVTEAFESYAKKITDVSLMMYHTSLKKLAERDKKQFTFKMTFYKFQRQWTSKSREAIAEFEEIRDLRLKVFEDIVDDDENVMDNSDNQILKGVKVLSIRRYFDSPESLISSFENELVSMTNRLLVTNIYMNRSIMTMIKKYEKNLEDELKSLFESVAPIFDSMREIANTYSQLMTDIVKFDVDNPHKVIRKVYMERFENRSAIIQATFKSIGKHLDKINKREEMINANARKWAKDTIDELKHTEKERFGMVIEEVRNYRENSLITIKKFMEYLSLETE